MDAAARETNTLAIVSLVFGILGWSFLPLLGSVVAIVTGHLARGEIRAAAENAPQGDGLAVAGLVLGYAALASALLFLVLLLAFFGGLAWVGAFN
jgi:site-specific recombinase